jgi:hypothetical protein
MPILLILILFQLGCVGEIQLHSQFGIETIKEMNEVNNVGYVAFGCEDCSSIERSFY